MKVTVVGLFNVNKMQHKVDKLLSIFTNLINELDKAISKLNSEIDANKDAIEKAQSNIEVYESKIAEYNTLKSNVESIVK